MNAVLRVVDGSAEAAAKFRLEHLLTGESAPMRRLRDVLLRLAPKAAPVLVQGPTGAGKERVTEALHAVSGRPGNLVALNCAAIPAELLESELFGHEKGAFTGATDRRIGRVEQAQGGTLFLDEIGDMPLALQAKLLRVLETRRIQRLGGTDEIAVDFRLVTATHRNLLKEVEAGRFRQDLYYRINVMTLSVPSLADRAEDIPSLVDTMAMQARALLGPGQVAEFSPAAMKALMAHDWPGNVRELRNVFDRACVLFSGQIVSGTDCRAELLDADPGTAEVVAEADRPEFRPDADGLRDVLRQTRTVHLRAYLQEIEAGLIAAALDLNAGCVAHAADALRLKRTTLIEKMRKLGINRAVAA
jgi:sigma-54 dependent transcriptional regulator, flagellar regulatory protein